MKRPEPIENVLVRYSAEEMPVYVIDTLRKQAAAGVTLCELSPKDAYKIVDLLLGIAVMKLQALPEVAQ